jgi:hypothetical protein
MPVVLADAGVENVNAQVDDLITSVRAAWLRFPAVTLKSLEQTYERVSESRYRYESGGGSFVAMLETNAVGFVTLYPGLWQLEEAGQLQRRTLRVCAGQLLDEADVALGHFPKYGGEWQVHSWLQQL